MGLGFVVPDENVAQGGDGPDCVIAWFTCEGVVQLDLIKKHFKMLLLTV